jgi:predicted Fe-S protein YdhL (DUF1289 family)
MNAHSRRSDVSSPCIRLCVLDRTRGICEGCGRTLAEIGGWLGFSEAERRAIMATLPERLAAPGGEGVDR